MGSYSIGERLNYLKENSFREEEIGNVLVYLVREERPRDLHESWDNYRMDLGGEVKKGLNRVIGEFEKSKDKKQTLSKVNQLEELDKNPRTKAYYENIRTIVYNIKSKNNDFPNGFFKDVTECFFKGSEESRKSGTNLAKEYNNALDRLRILYRDILTREEEV